MANSKACETAMNFLVDLQSKAKVQSGYYTTAVPPTLVTAIDQQLRLVSEICRPPTQPIYNTYRNDDEDRGIY